MNLFSIIVLIVLCVSVFFALRAIFVKKKGRCGGNCAGCPLSDTCSKKDQQPEV
ncbi:MAG: FeoB-associated Cys-rich membrane protein [Bacteroidales bacterium]|jgi:hypothetical protein|nr:FeoB-associated Cys-rich membrane protein [Bacteroidales bacterium]MDD3201597.1 FeoB-associated Cys-rich membrane protein [Bacteroidales bacterium]